MPPQTVEALLQNQLSACVAATEDCLVQSRVARADDSEGQLRRLDLDYVVKLMKASARLTEALAQLRGERRQEIHVRRSVDREGV